MLTVNLRPLFAARGIQNPYTILVKAGIAPHTATRLLNNGNNTFNLSQIEVLCHLLHCTPNDLLLWKADKKLTFPPNHPIIQLNKTNITTDVLQTLKTIPLDKLQQIATLLNQTP